MAAKIFRRTAQLDNVRAGDEKEHTVSLSFSSEYPVDNGDFDEVLSHADGDVDLARLNDSHPVLINHDAARQIGVIQKAWIDQRQKGRAVIKFSRSTRGTEAWQDVADGILKHVSVGYERVRTVAKKKLANGRQLIRFAWRPFEISLVPVPADPTVGIGRSSALTRNQVMQDNDDINNDNQNDPGQDQDRQQSRRDRRAGMAGDFRKREIQCAVDVIIENHPEGAELFRRMASEAILRGTPSKTFNAELLAAIPGTRKAEIYDCNLGMDERDIRRWSLTRAISSMIRDGRLSGVEAEAHRAYEAKFHQRAEGFFIPPDVIVGTRAGMHQRDMNVNTFGAGGAFVQTSIATPIIELLRNRMVCLRLGAQSLAGLVGNCAIPRQTGAGTAYSLAESATLTKSMQAIDQILLTPHRVGAYNEYSKQLLLQSSVDVENFIRDDLMKVVAIRWDSLMLIGSGSSSEPTGILHTTGVGSVNFGATATLAKVVSFETALAAANADAGPMAYVVSPTVKAAWKTIPKIGSTMPIFIWEDGDYGDGSNDGKVNSYRAASTNQIPNNQVFFGRFQDLIQAMWGGYDVVVNPYSRDIDAMVRITVNTFGDIAVRHAASFAVSADSGAQ